jgi:hypothetical protein
MKKLIAGLAAVTGLALVAAPAAQAATPDYVTVSNEDGVIQVSTQIPHQPLFGASVDTNTGEVCVGFSLQVPQCKTVPLDAIGVHTASPAQALPVTVILDTDASDGSVGVATGLRGEPLLSVRYSYGRLCAGFSYQIPFCIPVTTA